MPERSQTSHMMSNIGIKPNRLQEVGEVGTNVLMASLIMNHNSGS